MRYIMEAKCKKMYNYVLSHYSSLILKAFRKVRELGGERNMHMIDIIQLKQL